MLRHCAKTGFLRSNHFGNRSRCLQLYCARHWSLNTSLGMSSAFSHERRNLGKGVMVPGAEALQWHPAAMDRAIKAGALADDISRREERYRIGNLYIEAKGKVLSALLKEFIQKTLRELNSTFRGEYKLTKTPCSSNALGFLQYKLHS